VSGRPNGGGANGERQRRSWVLALVLVAFAALIYLITVARLSPGAGG